MAKTQMNLTVGPEVTDDMRSNGGRNKGTPEDQRKVREVSEAELDAGPKLGERGEYLPASYRTGSGNIVRHDR